MIKQTGLKIYEEQQESTNKLVFPVYPDFPPISTTQSYILTRTKEDEIPPNTRDAIIEKANNIRKQVILCCIESEFKLDNGKNLADLIHQTNQTNQENQIGWSFNLKYRYQHITNNFSVSIFFDHKYYLETSQICFIIEINPFSSKSTSFNYVLCIFNTKLNEANIIQKNKPKIEDSTAIPVVKNAILIDDRQAYINEANKLRNDYLSTGTQLTLIVQLMAGQMLEIVISSKEFVSELRKRVHEIWKKDVLFGIQIHQMRFSILTSIITNDSVNVTTNLTCTNIVESKEDVNEFTILENTCKLESYGNLNNKTIYLIIRKSEFKQPDIMTSTIEYVRMLMQNLNIYDIDLNIIRSLIYECNNPIAMREMVLRGIIKLINQIIHLNNDNNNHNDNVNCCVSTLLFNLMSTTDPGISYKSQLNAQAEEIHIRLVQLIIRTYDPYVLLEASRALVVIGLPFLNSKAKVNPEFSDMVIQVIEKLRTHWNPEIIQIGNLFIMQ